MLKHSFYLLLDQWPRIFHLAHLLLPQLVLPLVETINLNLQIVDSFDEHLLALFCIDSCLARVLQLRAASVRLA